MNAGSTRASISKVRRRLLVRGVVQGVGFRPYVYQLARGRGLAGWVRNGPSGVAIEIEGAPEDVDWFVEALPQKGPPLMRIAAIEPTDVAPIDETQFVILESQPGSDAFTLVPPDICVCDACLAETRDPADRRFEYPFTNCTNCGPRYSIIQDIPYDRSQTTMAEFAMCAECRREYEDPGDRRFHAQPNACPVCGPHLWMAKPGEGALDPASAREVLEEVARLLLGGGIVAWKGLGGYQLACDARDGRAVAELRRRKRRSEKPFAVMVHDSEAAKRVCLVTEAERRVLESEARPIVLLARRPEAELAAEISCGNPNTGVMLPCTPMHELLFRILAERGEGDVPLVMTSGNISEEPIAIEDEEAMRLLAGVADAFVPHNRGIHTRVDDSVVRVFDGEPMLLRRARGYAPQPIPIGSGEVEALGCGAQQKSTLCLTKGGYGLLSQHLGDLENYETLRFFEETLERMERLFHVRPKMVAHDLHPDYLSTRLAMRMPAERRVGVQHHHAHIAACMAEHGLEGTVIGVAWDGTGLGTDGTIWGGEFLIADRAGFERAAHLRPVLMAGGDAAVREPWRIARAYLHDAFDSGLPTSVACNSSIPQAQIQVLDAMLRRRIQVVETSSCGRLFDAVASLAGLQSTVSFEGQAAMALEAIAAGGVDEAYAAVIDDAASGAIHLREGAIHLREGAIRERAIQLDMRTMVRQIVEDRERGVSAAVISAKFHRTLVDSAVDVCRRIRSRASLHRVCLSGGCFQNMRLLRGCVEQLRRERFEVWYPQRVPCNDGGIALGQAVVACELARRGV